MEEDKFELVFEEDSKGIEFNSTEIVELIELINREIGEVMCGKIYYARDCVDGEKIINGKYMWNGDIVAKVIVTKLELEDDTIIRPRVDSIIYPKPRLVKK